MNESRDNTNAPQQKQLYNTLAEKSLHQNYPHRPVSQQHQHIATIHKHSTLQHTSLKLHVVLLDK